MKFGNSLLALLACVLPLNAEEPAPGATHPFETDALRVPALVTGGQALIRNVTIHSAVAPAELGDVLVQGGDIEAIGEGLEAPPGVPVIDGTGMHLAPGAIDTHSHMAIERGINEGTLSITADCDITDSINADDVALYRALAGGTTTIQCLHGSANPIGGRSEVLKLRWHATADELRFPDAPQGIKFALGENVKRSNWGTPGQRFPNTRMGVESVFLRGFMRAREYRDEWQRYEDARQRGDDPAPPRRDVRLDVLVDILEGDVLVHSHCYRADEILMLLRTAESFGFRIQTLQHVLEGYKVAHEIAEHGAGTSTFSDWWAYKIEAYDAVPQNAALLDVAGVVSTINSDSNELVRHLYHEAAKSVRYAGLDPVAALRLCTLNGAIQLGVEDRVGSIEVGKDADLVLLDADPLSVYSVVQWTMVDGEIEFQRRDAFGFDTEQLVASTPPAVAGTMEAAAPNLAAGHVTAIVGGRLHPVSAPMLEDSTLLIQNGNIVGIGEELAIPVGATVIDATGMDVWPGMIALNTTIGLREIGSVRGTMDESESGGNQPDIRVTTAVNPDSAHIGVTRTNGITRSQTTPQGRGPLRGQSSIIGLEGDTWEELVSVDRDMLHLSYPRVSNNADKKEQPKAVEELRRLLEEAREYDRLSREALKDGLTPPPYDPRLAALAPFAKGEKTVALHANNAQTILLALAFAKEEELQVVLYGATEAWKVLDAVKAAGVSVVTGPVLRTASRYDPYDAPYTNPALLYQAGVPFAIMAADSENTRNLPFHAGFAAAFGLPHAEAVRAVTLSAAEILGIDDRVGSLTVGKVADIVITEGDLLEATSRVVSILIDGQPVDVKNRQTRLYERYRDRLERLQGSSK